MKKIETFENKKVLVLGLAKSGEAAARLLEKLGAIVTVNDGKPFDENPAAQSLLEEGIKVIFHVSMTRREMNFNSKNSRRSEKITRRKCSSVLIIVIIS